MNHKLCISWQWEISKIMQKKFKWRWVTCRLGNLKPINPQKGGALGWLSWLSVWLLISAQVMISQSVDTSPMLGSELSVQKLLGILFLSLFLCPSLVLSLSLSLSLKINKLKKKIHREEEQRIQAIQLEDVINFQELDASATIAGGWEAECENNNCSLSLSMTSGCAALPNRTPGRWFLQKLNKNVLRNPRCWYRGWIRCQATFGGLRGCHHTECWGFVVHLSLLHL